MPEVIQVNHDKLCAYGETWDMASKELYGTEFFAHVLMEYNPDYLDTVIFEGGEVLSYPVYDDDEIEAASNRTLWDVDV